MNCRAEYGFALLDWREDDQGDDVRVFAVWPLPDGALDRATALFPNSEGASWPIWIPNMKGISGLQASMISMRVKKILRLPKKPSGIVAWRGRWGEKVLAARDVMSSDVDDVQYSLSLPKKAGKGRNWVEFLDL